MSTWPQRHDDPPPILRLFDGARYDRSRWKLRQVLEEFYIPRILRAERDVTPATVANYRRYVQWWEALTPDPDVAQITRDDLREFRGRLRAADYARSPLPGARRYVLSPATQADILEGVCTILACAGPATDGDAETAEILDRPPPSLKAPKPRHRPKPAFTLARARALAEACRDMDAPRIAGVQPADWNYALLCCLLLSGARRDTARRLCWWMFEEREDGRWLVIPDEHVSKTGKGARLSVHPELWLAVSAVRTDSQYLLSIDRYQTRRRRRTDRHQPELSGDRLRTLLRVLQRRAGIPAAQWLSPQACRRSHFDWLDRVGYALARRVTQSAADHASAATTEGHYVDLQNRYRRRLPWLRPAAKAQWLAEREAQRRSAQDDPRQGKLFD